MRAHFRITSDLLAHIRRDLGRSHPFAAERVGFLTCRVGTLARNEFVVLGQTWHPVRDEDYVKDFSVGAMIGPAAFRKILQYGYANRVSVFHVHLHEHDGIPRFSRTDERETEKFVPDFWNVRPEFPHGALVLSNTSVTGRCWCPRASKPIPISEFRIVSAPMRWVRHE